MAEQSIVILINRDGMGQAPHELQQKIVKSFLQLLVEGDHPLPAAICLYTDGVKLAAEGSPVIEQLQNLEGRGVHVIVCSTCVDAYGLRESLQVGIVGGMHDIIEAQWRADKVITL